MQFLPGEDVEEIDPREKASKERDKKLKSPHPNQIAPEELYDKSHFLEVYKSQYKRSESENSSDTDSSGEGTFSLFMSFICLWNV